MAKPKMEVGIGIWAEKLNMTTVFAEQGGNSRRVPCTILVIKRGGNWVTDKMWPEKHGVYSVQVGYERYTPEGEFETTKLGKAHTDKLARNDMPPLRKLKNFRMRPHDWEKWEIGQKVRVSDVFEENDKIIVHGVTKMKGHAGIIKRWGHKRGPMTHGSKHHRRVGSMGAGTTPGRVYPGKHMPGHMGGDAKRIFTSIYKIIDDIEDDNMPETIIMVRGAVPGHTAYWKDGGSYVFLHKAYNYSDGRFQRDKVWLWYYQKGENDDPYVPIKGKAWTFKTMWGKDLRTLAEGRAKYWPDGFPGYDHSTDPFADDCDPRLAIKAPDW